jgi:hypothetical protein
MGLDNGKRKIKGFNAGLDRFRSKNLALSYIIWIIILIIFLISFLGVIGFIIAGIYSILVILGINPIKRFRSFSRYSAIARNRQKMKEKYMKKISLLEEEFSDKNGQKRKNKSDEKDKLTKKDIREEIDKYKCKIRMYDIQIDLLDELRYNATIHNFY